MDQHYFIRSIRNTITQVADVFNGINVAKYNQNGEIVKLVKVPLHMAPKEKFLYWMYKTKKFEKRLPIMGLSMTSISYATGRQKNNITPINYSIDEEWLKHLNPTPYDMNFKLSIVSQYIVEMDQILEQILPFFDPYVMVQIDIPEFATKYSIKVVLNSINQETTPDTPSDDYRMVTWSLDFTAQSFIFKPIADSGVVKKIIQRYYMNSDSFSAMQGIDPNITDSYPLSANHDFDTATVYMEGEKINDAVKVIKMEEYKGDE